MGTIRPSLNGLYSLLIHSGDAGSHLYWQEGNEGVSGGACPGRSRLLPDQGDCRPGALSVPPCVWTATVRNPAPLFLWDSQFLVCLGWPAEVRTGGWPAGVRACRSALACPSLHRWRPARTRGTRWLQRNAPEWFQIQSDWLFRTNFSLGGSESKFGGALREPRALCVCVCACVCVLGRVWSVACIPVSGHW